MQFQPPDKSPLPPSVEAVSPQGVVTPNPSTSGTPDPTQPTPPGTTAPPPTSTNPQDGPLGVVAPTTITSPNLPPVDPNGSPTGVTPPPGWKPPKNGEVGTLANDPGEGGGSSSSLDEAAKQQQNQQNQTMSDEQKAKEADKNLCEQLKKDGYLYNKIGETAANDALTVLDYYTNLPPEQRLKDIFELALGLDSGTLTKNELASWAKEIRQAGYGSESRRKGPYADVLGIGSKVERAIFSKNISSNKLMESFIRQGIALGLAKLVVVQPQPNKGPYVSQTPGGPLWKPQATTTSFIPNGTVQKAGGVGNAISQMDNLITFLAIDAEALGGAASVVNGLKYAGAGLATAGALVELGGYYLDPSTYGNDGDGIVPVVIVFKAAASYTAANVVGGALLGVASVGVGGVVVVGAVAIGTGLFIGWGIDQLFLEPLRVKNNPPKGSQNHEKRSEVSVWHRAGRL